jgi:hypothetical protein
VGVQQGNGRAAWTWAFSVDKSMQHEHRLSLNKPRQRITLFSEDFAEELAELSESQGKYLQMLAELSGMY